MKPAAADRRAAAVLAAALIAAVAWPLASNDSYFFRDDLKNQYLPGYAEAVQAWQEGEPALLTSLSWRSGALAGEYQYAVFQPVLAACNLILFSSGLPPHLIAAALAAFHLLILGFGCYVLARSKGLDPPLAVMVGLVASLNGWVFYWGVNWFPMLSSFAYLPWVWWLLERAVAFPRSDVDRGRGRETVAAGLLIALIFASGWPFTCLMIGLITGFVGLRCVYEHGNLKAVLSLALSVAIGLGLSAPAWLMLVEYSGSTMRGQTTAPLALQDEFVVPLKAYLGMVLPTVKAAWTGPWLPAGDTDSKVMHVGLAPVVLLIAAVVALRGSRARQLQWDLLLLLVLVNLASLPSIGVFKWSFRWLPLLFLQLALVAGRAAVQAGRSVDAQPGRPRHKGRFRPGLVAPLVVAAVAGYALGVDGDVSTRNVRLAAGMMAVALGWTAAEHFRLFGRWRRHLPWLVVCASSAVTFAVAFKGYQPVRRPAGAAEAPVLDPSITYLALYDLEQHVDPTRIVTFGGQRYFPGNEHMHSGLRFVNGYSPMGPAGIDWLVGFDFMGAVPPKGGPETGRPSLDGVLRRMAVDGLVVWPGMETARSVSLDDFEQVAALPDAGVPEVRVFHRRTGRTPRVQAVRGALVTAPVEKIWQLPRSPRPVLEKPGAVESGVSAFDDVAPAPLRGDAALTLIEEGRHRVEVEVDATTAERPVVTSFARPWFPGYRATLDGEPTTVLRLDGLMPAVEVPAGRRARVLLHYRPRSLVVGLVISGLTVAAMLLAEGLVANRRRHRQ